MSIVFVFMGFEPAIELNNNNNIPTTAVKSVVGCIFCGFIGVCVTA